MTTTSVVVGNAGRTSRQEINVGVSTLERDVLDGRLEIHVVLDDADRKGACMQAKCPKGFGLREADAAHSQRRVG